MEMKLPFKVYVDGRSEEIQKHLFTLGCEWDVGGAMVLNRNNPFIFINEDKIISCGSVMTLFKDHRYPETSADQVLTLTIEKPPVRRFDPFDRVLVRGNNDGEWFANIYSRYDSNNGVHICISCAWYQCIPYKGNEHLLGTTDNPV